jgi:peptide/nickel transport system ATP-binding protein
MALLDVNGLSVSFGTQRVVEDVTLSIAPGERVGLIGESGSGKTLTSLAMVGLLPDGARAAGTVAIDGEPLPSDERALARLRGRRIGMVFQEPMTALNPLMTVRAQIAEAIALGETPGDAGDLLEEVGLTREMARRYPHQLSGGQRQRVMIAMALASRPDLLIADEPTSALDLITQATVLDLIARLCRRRGMALLFISHDLKAVAKLCERIIVMRTGRIVEDGLTRPVLAKPRHEYTRELIAASRLSGRRIGRGLAATKVLLETHGLTRIYRRPGAFFVAGERTVAVDDVTMRILEGESVALVGPSGCGKSTLARLLVGLDRASSGHIVFAGQNHHGGNLPARLRRDLSLVFQDPFASFDPRMTIERSLAEPLRLLDRLGEEDRQSRLVEAVTAVGLDARMLRRYPHEFSGGQRQRLAIARALVTRPRLVVLDEPVSALDVSIRGDILGLLGRLQSEFGLTYLIISHDLDMVRAVADRVLVMDAGRIVEQGEPEELFARPQHKMTAALAAARLPDLSSAG